MLYALCIYCLELIINVIFYSFKGVDLVSIKPIHNVITLQEDITTNRCRQVLKCVQYRKSNYKITKIVRVLWLAERSVCMRVCKHGFDVKMFCFSRTNHANTNLKTFSSSKLDKITLFTHSFVGWNLENRYN